jgi:hypothetical protein
MLGPGDGTVRHFQKKSAATAAKRNGLRLGRCRLQVPVTVGPSMGVHKRVQRRPPTLQVFWWCGPRSSDAQP